MNRLKSLLLPLLLLAPLALWQGAAAAEDAPPAEFSQGQLDAMLAPIALYPDTLLSHILIAATYPLEVIQADRWVKANPGLEGEAAVNAVDNQDWDPSVKALVAFPRLLAQMSEDLDWIQQLGDAFLLDEARVVASIQNLRQRAHEAGNLKSNEYVEVHHEPESIIIEPAVRHVVYVPYYDTRVVYGTWWWPTYHPVYWGYPAHYHAHSGFYWSSGIRVHSGFFFSSFYWPSHRIVVVHHHHHHPHRFYSGRSVAHYQGAQHWRHNPYHRRGVSYRHEQVNRHYNVNRPSLESRQRQQSGGLLREAVNQRQQVGGSQATGTRTSSPRADHVRNRLRDQQVQQQQGAPDGPAPQREQRQQRDGSSTPQRGLVREAIGNRQNPEPQAQQQSPPQREAVTPRPQESTGSQGLRERSIQQQRQQSAPRQELTPQQTPPREAQPQRNWQDLRNNRSSQQQQQRPGASARESLQQQRAPANRGNLRSQNQGERGIRRER